jgi:hypothetical protein
MQRNEYQKVFAISQSAIKAFKTKGLAKFKKIYIDKEEDDEDDQDKFAYGSLVDTLAFQPKLLDERFYILDTEVPLPKDKLKLVIDKTYKEAVEIVDNKVELNRRGNLPEPLYVPDITEISEWYDLIFKYAREITYGGTTWSRTRICDNAYEEGYLYFRMLGKANGRSIINSQENADAIETVEALRNHPRTKRYFVQQENQTLLFQQEIFLEFNVSGMPIPLKGALDIIHFDHDAKTVQVPDLKTTYNAQTFKTIAKSFDYTTQASFYNFLLREWLKTYEDGKYVNYTCLNPINIAIDATTKEPYIYEYDWSDLEIVEHGSEENNVQGWRSILEEIAWHLQSGVWNCPKELHETGKIKLKIFRR